MFVIYHRTRKTLVVVTLAFLASCQLFKEDKIEAKRNLWFEESTKQLDQLFVVANNSLGDSLKLWLKTEERILNHFEPFCSLIELPNDTTYQLVFEQKKFGNTAFEFNVVKNKIIVFYSNKDFFFEQKTQFLVRFKLLCHDLFVNQRKNRLVESGYLKTEFTELNRYHPWSIKLPDDFKIVRHKENYLWIRTETVSQNSHIMIYRTNYENENQFDLNSLVDLRDSLAKRNILYEKYDSTVYMETEFYFPLTLNENSFDDFYSKRVNGAWSLNKNIKQGFAMGGLFVGYGLVDSKKPKDFYYLDAFFSAPNVNKLPYIRTLEAILRTFELNKDYE